MSTKTSYILKQSSSSKLQVCWSMYDLSVDSRLYRVKFSLFKIRLVIYIKQGCSHFKQNEWDIPLSQTVKVFNELAKTCFPLGKIEFWALCEFCAYCRIVGLRKGPEYLYCLFHILPKQSCEMKMLQVQVYINNDFMVNKELNLCKV